MVVPICSRLNTKLAACCYHLGPSSCPLSIFCYLDFMPSFQQNNRKRNVKCDLCQPGHPPGVRLQFSAGGHLGCGGFSRVQALLLMSACVVMMSPCSRPSGPEENNAFLNFTLGSCAPVHCPCNRAFCEQYRILCLKCSPPCLHISILIHFNFSISAMQLKLKPCICFHIS